LVINTSSSGAEFEFSLENDDMSSSADFNFYKKFPRKKEVKSRKILITLKRCQNNQKNLLLRLFA
jgi:hypothetical protein